MSKRAALHINEKDNSVGFALCVLLEFLAIPETKLAVHKKADQATPAAELPSGAKVTGAVTIGKLLAASASSPPEYLGLTDSDKAKVEEQIASAANLAAELNDKAKKDKTFAELNNTLASKVFIATNYFTLADVFTYAALYTAVSKLNKESRLNLSNVTRYFDLIQHLVHANKAVKEARLVEIDLDCPVEEKPAPVEEKKKEKPTAGGDAPADGKKKDKGKKDKKDDKESPAKGDKGEGAKAKEDKKAKDAKPADKSAKDAPKKEAKAAPATTSVDDSDVTPEPERLDLRIGLIKNVSKHAQADSLYVEEVDLGEAQPRTVVSGLVKYMKESDLQDKMVVLLCNLKPVKMRGIESQAMVLAATSADGNTVEVLEAPKGSKPGDRVWFDTHVGTDFSQLNSKKKIWENVQPHLQTDGSRRAVFATVKDGVRNVRVLRNENGEVTVKSITGGSIK
ncbi:hypothetical protein HDV05_006368 [Chytridiales sp. JEL 0842]|nr:hypothetical protein HDV05_006368 [Chytridiales sp. JEL 0842]